MNLKSLKPAYTQKTKHFDREKLQDLHILKKIKKIKKPSHLRQWLPHRVWDFWFFWFFWAYAGSLSIFSIFLSICRCCALLASKCWFFWVYAGYVHSSKIMHFLLLMQALERYKSQNLQRVCNFEVNKAQMKNGIRFCFSFYFLLLKNNDHQNKTNRMSKKSEIYSVFWACLWMHLTPHLVSDTFPSFRGRPWRGGLPYIYIYMYIYI